ncbi:unnamed protein product [Zymoseptoria tritici ST99CH_3D1]|nr:unnamed protein product [Zymoseptoria tritici ST99CH_3D1]
MSVRVVARIRPLLKAEEDKDIIVEAAGDNKNVVKIPNPKSDSEHFSFQFSSVYGQTATQADLFDSEVAPTVKHLFKGFDVTLFAYGVTGTGKTHTMRGGKSLAERGVIPRLLSSIYRRARKIEKDTAGESKVEVVMSYYEIYNDRVFDLFEPPEKRTPAGLPIRDNQSGKAIVVGLTERPCTSLKDFEQMYDQANVNRSTSATKLNAHSSRSHAVLCVKVTQTTGDQVQVSTASAIDLAGSEDNRRTDNNKERLVESASINKSLFVLASCVEAISRKATRIPYRESKMTRILALGQNNGLTIMILNLAPVRSYHLDTLSSLNFANRTKKIEVNEIENIPFFRDPLPGKPKADMSMPAPSMNRQPLRSKVLSQTSHLKDVTTTVPKPTKQFAVFSDATKPSAKARPAHLANTSSARLAPQSVKSPKRTSSEASMSTLARPSKRPAVSAVHAGMSQDAIERLIEQKVSEALSNHITSTVATKAAATEVERAPVESNLISVEVQRRLDALEKRVEGQESERAEGLQLLLQAKQMQANGEKRNALEMFERAERDFFPGNEKLSKRIGRLRDSIEGRPAKATVSRKGQRDVQEDEDHSYHAEEEDDEEDYDDKRAAISRTRTKIRRPQPFQPTSAATRPIKSSYGTEDSSYDELNAPSSNESQTPRTRHLLQIINSRDINKIQLLKGVGRKKAEKIVECLCELDLDAETGEDGGSDDEDGGRKMLVVVRTLEELGDLKGMGRKGVEGMRAGVLA